MHYNDRLKTISEIVHAAPFPVYGLTNHMLDLQVYGSGLGISHLSFLISVTFAFSSPRYSDAHPRHSYYSIKSKNFEITSVDAAAQRPERENIPFVLDEPSDSEVFSDNARWLFQEYHFSEEEQKQAGRPSLWRGTCTISNTNFSGKVLSWKPPLRVSQFLLQSEGTILLGNAYGPSSDEIMQILENLQNLHHQEDAIGQYEREIRQIW